MKFFCLVLLCVICVSGEVLQLTDTNFQRKTLIGKHIPIQNWVIAFCTDKCNESVLDVVNSLESPTLKVGFVNLEENKWILRYFQPGIYFMNTENKMGLLSQDLNVSKETLSQSLNNGTLIKIPQLFRKIEVDFWTFDMIFVHIGIIILIVFLILAFRDGYIRFKEQVCLSDQQKRQLRSQKKQH